MQTLRPLTIHLFTATAQGPTAQAAFHAALRRPAGLRAHRRGLCVRAVVMRCVQIPPVPECPFMNTFHCLRFALIAWLIAAATSAFAQTPTCHAAPGTACLYAPAASYGFTPFERSIVYTDSVGLACEVKRLMRLPVGAPLPMPVVVWSHGGTAGKRDPANSMAEWNELSARAGYTSISIAHSLRDTSRDLCVSIGMDAASRDQFVPLKRRPRSLFSTAMCGNCPPRSSGCKAIPSSRPAAASPNGSTNETTEVDLRLPASTPVSKPLPATSSIRA